MKYQGSLQILGRSLSWLARLRQALTVGILAGAVFSVSAADSTGTASTMTDYARWIKPWSEHTNSSSRLGVELKVIVTFISGEQPLSVVTNLTPVQRLNLAYHLKTTGTEITTNGGCWSFFASNSTATEAPIRWLSPGELKKLDELLAGLPDDGQTLPPPGKRVIVQVLEAGHWNVRVYDLTSAPAEVRALLAFIGNPFEHTL